MRTMPRGYDAGHQRSQDEGVGCTASGIRSIMGTEPAAEHGPRPRVSDVLCRRPDGIGHRTVVAVGEQHPPYAVRRQGLGDERWGYES